MEECMPRNKKNKSRKPSINQQQLSQSADQEQVKDSLKWKKIEIQFKTKSQEQLWTLIDKNQLTFISGPAGTGKTYLSIVKAIKLLSAENSPYKKIIIVKPVVEADEKLGALPGTMEEKLEPYIYSYTYLFEKLLGQRKMQKLIDQGVVKIMALAYLRGVNIEDSVLLFDEAQNCTKRQMKTILTRIGDNCKYIISGDLEQRDRQLNKNEEDGLTFAMKKLKNIDDIGIFEFHENDIVRNPIINSILKKFNGDV